MSEEISLITNSRYLIDLIERAATTHEKLIRDLSFQICEKLRLGNTIFWCGNGGSAAESQHMAAELMGRFLLNRSPLASISLTTDTSAITAIGNDFDFDEIFSRQLSGLGRPGDTLVSFSTSGESKNVIQAINEAKRKEIMTISFTGRKASTIGNISDYCLNVESTITARIQEVHTLMAHTLCQNIEQNLFSK
jgi:D-sedoheptulose 7-phosphate isomerase